MLSENAERDPSNCQFVLQHPINPEIIERAGEDMFLLMYQAAHGQKDLNRHRYTCFIKSSTKARGNLASLPPTKGAAEQNSRNGLGTTISIHNSGVG